MELKNRITKKIQIIYFSKKKKFDKMEEKEVKEKSERTLNAKHKKKKIRTFFLSTTD